MPTSPELISMHSLVAFCLARAVVRCVTINFARSLRYKLTFSSPTGRSFGRIVSQLRACINVVGRGTAWRALYARKGAGARPSGLVQIGARCQPARYSVRYRERARTVPPVLCLSAGCVLTARACATAAAGLSVSEPRCLHKADSQTARARTQTAPSG